MLPGFSNLRLVHNSTLLTFWATQQIYCLQRSVGLTLASEQIQPFDKIIVIRARVDALGNDLFDILEDKGQH